MIGHGCHFFQAQNLKASQKKLCPETCFEITNILVFRARYVLKKLVLLVMLQAVVSIVYKLFRYWIGATTGFKSLEEQHILIARLFRQRQSKFLEKQLMREDVFNSFICVLTYLSISDADRKFDRYLYFNKRRLANQFFSSSKMEEHLVESSSSVLSMLAAKGLKQPYDKYLS